MNSSTGLQQLLQGKRLLIFDFDGTVADTSPLHAAAFVQVLAPLGVTVDYPTIAGLKTLDAMRQCLAVAGQRMQHAEVAALVAAKQQLVRQMISGGLKAMPGADEFLQWARPGYRLSMATSGSRATVALALAKLGYEGWFDPIICADDVQRAKPDPEGFLSVLTITGVLAREALVFEDSDAGLAAAASAGIATWDARRGYLDRSSFADDVVRATARNSEQSVRYGAAK